MCYLRSVSPYLSNQSVTDLLGESLPFVSGVILNTFLEWWLGKGQPNSSSHWIISMCQACFGYSEKREDLFRVQQSLWHYMCWCPDYCI